MQNNLKWFIITALLIIYSDLNAQKMKISGTVYDTSGTKPLSNAMIMAVRVKDSLLLGFTRSDKNGFFQLENFQIDTISLVIEYPNLDERTYYIFGHQNNYEIDIPKIRLNSKSKELEEVVIYANKNPIYYKGDTLVYVADSFKVAEGAVVEDLLKKLPGIKIDKEGKITSQGQEINKVLVDGDEFFGTDPTIATKNLGADGIEAVQIYDKKDEEKIGGTDEKIKVLDLKLKEKAKKGYFGRISGASDFAILPKQSYMGNTPFYETELLLNKFNSKQKISVFALGSNTPRSNFGRGDMNKFGLSNEDGANRNFWEPNDTKNSNGIPQTFKAGLYYSDKFGKKKNTEVLFNYSYYNDKLDARSSSQSQYFLRDTTYFTDDISRNYTNNETHRINLTIQSQIDSLTLIEFKPSVNLDKGISNSHNDSKFFGNKMDLDNSENSSLGTIIDNTNTSSGIKLNNTTRLYRKFRKKRRELEIRYDLAMSQNETNGYLNSSINYSGAKPDSVIDQNKRNNNASISHYGNFSYFEPLSKRWKVNINYLAEFGNSNQHKETYDKLNDQYAAKNALLSNEFDTKRAQNRIGTDLIYENGKHYISGGAFTRNIRINNHNMVTDSIIKQDISNLLPKFKYEYKPSMSKRFTLTYNTNSQQPQINDLQPVRDNTNPNRIQIGNPDLKPNYVHTLMFNFNTWNAISGKYLWSGANVNITNNAFATETNFDNYGRTTSKTINVDGNISASMWCGGGYPILDRKIEFEPSINASFNRTNSYIGATENRTDNYSITPEFDIDIEFDSLIINLRSSYSFNNPKNSLSTVSNTPYTIENYGIEFDWKLPKGFGISSEGNFTRNSQPGKGFYNISYFIWNAEFSKKILKTQNLTISIKGNDILNQNINARRSVNGNAVTDYRTTIISRYFLIKLNYRFNNRKTKEDDFKGWH